MQTRRTLIAALAATSAASPLLAACGGGGLAAQPVSEADVTLGNAEAPVTVIEYHSVACPVCARWALEVWPQFKEKYIDTGQVKYVSREMLAHNPQLAMSGFLLARCAGEERYFDVVKDIYDIQGEMEMSGQYRAGLLRVARQNGISEAEFDTCTSDVEAINRLREQSNAYAISGFNSTPTFVVGDQVMVGFRDLEQLDQAIAEARGGE